MKVTATLRCVKTGETRANECDIDAKFLGNQAFFWTDGNFGCDCNRRLAFVWAQPNYSSETHETLLAEQLRAEGLPVEMIPRHDGLSDDVESPCGHEAFELVSLVTADGQDLLKGVNP